ncbi:MAG: hypothetical protein Q7R96_01975, partial [Nanoarchaeota archaeon]|nr:hypothetical protein [Nanoarchaeota archaeon]
MTAKKKEEKTPEATPPGPKLPEMPPEVKEQFEALKKKLDTLQKQVLEKFDKYILGISLLPPEQPQPLPPGLPPEQAASIRAAEEQKKKDINVLFLVDDSDSEKMSKLELRDKMLSIIDKQAADIDKNLKPDVMLMTELRESLFDAKYEVLKIIGLSAPLYDPKDLLAALKIAEVHRSMVIKKF